MASNRLELLKRKNAGLGGKQKLEQKLFREHSFPTEHCRFLDLEESDVVMESGKTRFASRHREAEQEAKGCVPFVLERQLSIEKLQAATPPIPVNSADIYVVFLDSDKTGALAMSARVFCRHWIDLVEIDPDGFSVLEQGSRNKLVIQVLVGEGTEGDMLDIGVWGNEWGEVVAGMAELAFH